MYLIRKVVIFLFCSLISFAQTSKAFEIKNIVAVNNHVITNIDLINTISFYEILERRKINFEIEKNKFLNILIENKIKENELNTSFKNFKIKDAVINKLITEYKKNLKSDLEKIDPYKKKIFEENLYYNIKISQLWNKVIYYKFQNLITVNQNEISKVIKEKKLSKQESSKYIDFERQKSLQKISKSFLEELKNKYLIKYF